MDDHLRACLANVAARLVTGQNVACVFDCHSAVSVPLAGHATPHGADLFDPHGGRRLMGAPQPGGMLLSMPGTTLRITLSIAAETFHGSVTTAPGAPATTFTGTVRRNLVTLQDFSDGLFYRYNF
ncbi:MAG: hypothetical protein AB7E47_05255 [Desulfovibrionaceae bacterium]